MLSLPELDIMPQVLKETIEQKKNNASLQKQVQIYHYSLTVNITTNRIVTKLSLPP
jgi:hypothetical protein